MNIKGTYEKIPWIGFDRQREGRRREFILKFKIGKEWRSVTAPREIDSESRFRRWVASELQTVADLGVETKRNTDPTTVASLYERWIVTRERNEDLAGATVKNSRNRFTAHILPRWGTTPIGFFDNRAGHAELREWVRELSSKLSPGSCHNVVSSFATFFRDIDLEAWVTLRSNPMKSPRVLTVLPKDKNRRAIVVMPPEVAQGLLAAHPDTKLRSRVRYALGVCTGANDGELSGCQVLHVLGLNGPEPTLEITQAFKMHGNRLPKANGKRGSALGPTKNKYRVRPIPLNECARAALIEWLDEGWEEFVGRPWKPSDPLLPSSMGKFSRARLPIRRDLERLGLPTHDSKGKPFEFRTLRRTFSTMLRAAKVDREIRERLMGQSSASVNSEHYTAEVPAELRDAVRRLPLTWPHGGALVARLGGQVTEADVSRSSGSTAATPRKVSDERRDRPLAKISELVAADAHVVAIRAAIEGARHQEFGDDADAEAFRQAVVEHRVSVEASALAVRPIAKASGKPARAAKRPAGGHRG